MALTAAQMTARDGKLTASRVGILMKGEPNAVYDLWREMTGDPSYIPEDLSDVWPVQLGSETEALHLRWYAKRTGRAVLRAGDVVVHPKHIWASCTLDGWDAVMNVPIECKHVGSWRKMEDCLDAYAAQLHWQMLCTGAKKAIISVIFGSAEPVQQIVNFDEAYATELLRRAHDFWVCVENLMPPVMMAAVAAPVPPEKMRKVDLSQNNSWCSNAVDWLANKEAAKKFEASSKEIKALIEADVCEAVGAGIICTRNKAGSLSIKEAK